MSRYGKIESGFWHSQKIRQVSEKSKFLMLYLLSCPHGNAIGCFVLPEGYIEADLSWPGETVRQTLSELSQNGLIERDEATMLTRIVGWWGHNSIENANVAKFVCKEITFLPNCSVKQSLVDDLLSRDEFHATVRQTLSERLGKPFRNQEPNLTLQEPNHIGADAPDTPSEKPKGRRRKPEVPLPDDWSTSSANRERAKKLGFTDREIDREAEKFLNHARQKDRRCADWEAAERNWFLNAAEYRGKVPRAETGQRDWRAIVQLYRDRELWTAPGPEPGYSGCQAPPEILREFGYLPENVPRETQCPAPAT